MQEPEENSENSRSEDIDGLIQKLLAALDSNPDDWQTRLDLAHSYVKANQSSSARRMLLQIAEGCPDWRLAEQAGGELQTMIRELNAVGNDDQSGRRFDDDNMWLD